MKIPKCTWPKSREIVAFALARSREKNKESLADHPFPRLARRDKSSLLLVATVEPPPSIPFDPSEPTNRVARDVELLEVQGAHASLPTLQGMLQECMDYRSLPDLRRVHNHIVSNDKCTRQLGNHLVRAYGACGDPTTAMSVFRGLFSRDSEAWLSAMDAMASSGRHRDVFKLFRSMLHEGNQPVVSIYLEVLGACGELGNGFRRETRLLHDCIRSSRCRSDIDVLNKLMETLERVGLAREAKEVLRLATQGANARTWSFMMQKMVKDEDFAGALKLFFKMKSVDKKVCVLALRSCSSLSHAHDVHLRLKKFGMDKNVELAMLLFEIYVRFEKLEEARVVFDGVDGKDVEWWESMADTYAVNGDFRSVLALYRCMSLNGIKYSLKLQNEILETCQMISEGRRNEEVTPAIAA